MGLPVPFKKYIPKIFQDDPLADTLADKVDIDLTQWQKDAISLARIYRPDECPAGLLDYLADFLAADILPYDSEFTKRGKIRDAVASHKNRGTWDDDAKQRVDNITGLSPGARVLSCNSMCGDDWILSDGDTVYFPTANYWASLGVDGLDDDLGIALIGGGDEIVISGNIYIDCHEGVTISTLTADQIARIVTAFSGENKFAYFKLYFGYIDGSGIFQLYVSVT